MKDSKASSKVKRVPNKEKRSAKEKENKKRSNKTTGEQPKTGKVDDEMDLSKELYPISHYINSKEEMVNQLFSVVKSSDLKALLPACLKNYSITELKKLCLEHLQLMSQKKILSILQGTSVFSLPENEEDKSGQIPLNKLNCDQTDNTQGLKRPLSHLDDSQQADSTSVDLPEGPAKKKATPTVCQSPSPVNKDLSIDVDIAGEDLDLCPNEEELNSLMKESFVEKINEPGSQQCADVTTDNQVHISSTTMTVEVGEKEWLNAFTKTQLEILELEMRARAIRSLMRAQGLHTSDSDTDLEKKKELGPPV